MTYRKLHTRFRLVPKSTILDDLERPLRTVFKTRASFGAHHENLNEDRLHCQRRRWLIRFMRIFAGVPWKGGVIQQWGTGAVLAQKFWGRGIAPICPFITESIFSVLQNRKNTNFISAVCAKKVTPFWYLSFLPLLDALYLQFVFTYISFTLNAWYQSQCMCIVVSTGGHDPAGWCTITHWEKHDILSQKGDCFIHQASDVASKQPWFKPRRLCCLGCSYQQQV